jgi:acyl carrier protein
VSPNDVKLRNLLIDVLLIDEDQYRDDFGPDEISSWDSVGMVEIAVAVEQQFGYMLAPDEMVNLRSIGDIKDVLRSQGIDFAE